MNRRDLLGSIALGGGATLLASKDALAGALAPASSAAYAQAVRGTGPVKIRDIKTILTAPNRIRLVVVKVETTEPGLVVSTLDRKSTRLNSSHSELSRMPSSA